MPSSCTTLSFSFSLFFQLPPLGLGEGKRCQEVSRTTSLYGKCVRVWQHNPVLPILYSVNIQSLVYLCLRQGLATLLPTRSNISRRLTSVSLDIYWRPGSACRNSQTKITFVFGNRRFQTVLPFCQFRKVRRLFDRLTRSLPCDSYSAILTVEGLNSLFCVVRKISALAHLDCYVSAFLFDHG